MPACVYKFEHAAKIQPLFSNVHVYFRLLFSSLPRIVLYVAVFMTK